jgi:hypothetical protein
MNVGLNIEFQYDLPNVKDINILEHYHEGYTK